MGSSGGARIGGSKAPDDGLQALDLRARCLLLLATHGPPLAGPAPPRARACGWKRRPPLYGPRLLSCCTRYALKVATWHKVAGRPGAAPASASASAAAAAAAAGYNCTGGQQRHHRRWLGAGRQPAAGSPPPATTVPKQLSGSSTQEAAPKSSSGRPRAAPCLSVVPQQRQLDGHLALRGQQQLAQALGVLCGQAAGARRRAQGGVSGSARPHTSACCRAASSTRPSEEPASATGPQAHPGAPAPPG